jgi:nucleolar protein 56
MMGSFAYDKDKKMIDYRLFPKKPEEIVERLEKAKEAILPEEKEIIFNLIQLGYKELVWDKSMQFEGIGTIQQEENIAKQALQEDFRKLAIELQWVTTQAEFNEIMSKVNVLLTRQKLKEERRDKLIMHAVGVLDELDKTLNNFSERIREWYGLYFPEAGQLKSHEKYLEVVARFGKKENITEDELRNLVSKSSGMELTEKDIYEIQEVAKQILGLYQTKKTLTKYTEAITREVMPNTSAVAGELLAARLISAAGGLDKLARLPSSTVQLLGAEKALFRHLKDKRSKAPKYGILFAHPHVQNAPREKRGKVARLISAKINLAAKTDFFSKSDKGAELKKDLENKIKVISKRA